MDNTGKLGESILNPSAYSYKWEDGMCTLIWEDDELDLFPVVFDAWGSEVEIGVEGVNYLVTTPEGLRWLSEVIDDLTAQYLEDNG